MPEIQRGLIQLLEDLDRRARPGRPSRYRAIQKYVSVTDTWYVTPDSITTSFYQDFQWGQAASSSQRLYWNLGEWR